VPVPDLIRSACLTDYAEIARSVGLEPLRMLDAVGLPRSCLRDPDMKIPVGAVARLFEASARAAGIEDFGLRLSERRRLSVLGPVGLIMREQPTVRKAIEALARYSRLHNEAMRIAIRQAGDVVIMSPELVVRRPGTMRQSIDLSVGVLYRILRIFLGDRWRPQSVAFIHPAPRRRDTYRRLFGTRVEFGADFNGIVCASRDIDVPMPAFDPAMARYVHQYLESVVGRPQVSTAEKVRELVTAMLPSGRCSIETVAAQLGVDRRTLHRHLAQDGETFSAVLDAVRTETVTRYLENRNRPLYVIAEMLGFSALSAFSRWFRAHFGCSVSSWRKANGPDHRSLSAVP
jgi:AraC-like DNA-binding protein